MRNRVRSLPTFVTYYQSIHSRLKTLICLNDVIHSWNINSFKRGIPMIKIDNLTKKQRRWRYFVRPKLLLTYNDDSIAFFNRMKVFARLFLGHDNWWIFYVLMSNSNDLFTWSFPVGFMRGNTSTTLALADGGKLRH